MVLDSIIGAISVETGVMSLSCTPKVCRVSVLLYSYRCLLWFSHLECSEVDICMHLSDLGELGFRHLYNINILTIFHMNVTVMYLSGS